jgi:hypothetical protein
MGWKLDKDNEIRHEQNEERVKATIRALLGDGWCVQEIADHLNICQILNKEGKKWTAMAIARASRK